MVQVLDEKTPVVVLDLMSFGLLEVANDVVVVVEKMLERIIAIDVDDTFGSYVKVLFNRLRKIGQAFVD